MMIDSYARAKSGCQMWKALAARIGGRVISSRQIAAMTQRWRRRVLVGGAIAAFVLLSGCDVWAKLFATGPFEGQVIDADTGQPIAGAFVGYTWGGSDWIEGHHPHMLDVLVRSDATGIYRIPSQRENLSVAGRIQIHWGAEAWAPGYVLGQMGESDEPGARAKDGGLTRIALKPVTSAPDALGRRHRMDSGNYHGSAASRDLPDDKVHNGLILALYRDSYHRVCEREPSAALLAREYVEIPHSDGSRVRRQLHVPDVADANDAWPALYRQAGWIDAGGPVKQPPALDKPMLQELCRLSRVASVFPENPP